MEVVRVSETTLVAPSTAPFSDSHLLSLSHLDNDHNLNVTFRYLRAYANTLNTHIHPPSADPFSVVSTALSHALVKFYPLAGTLRRRQQDGRLELFCSPGDAVPLILAKANCRLDNSNYLDESDPDFVEKMVPDPNPDEGLTHPCILQVTLFECGGFVLGAGIHHAICDGLGASLFFNAMAELARGSSVVKVDPVWDRNTLLGPRDPPRVEAAVEEFLDLDKETPPYSHEVGKVVRECFLVKDECLDRFKAVLLEHSAKSFTTFEALCAYIWRAK